MKIVDIFETPLAGYETLSDKPNSKSGDASSISRDREDFNNRSSSYGDKRDRRLLTNPISVQRIKDQFENTEVNFYFYMINSKEGKKFTEVGVVDRAWLEENMPSVAPHIPDHSDDDGITVLYTNNSGAQKFPMTPWIMCHRLAHAFQRGNWLRGGRPISTYTDAERAIDDTVNDILRDNYGYTPCSKKSGSFYDGDTILRDKLIRKKFFEAIGKFRSARKGKLRDDFEFLNEVFAQYLMTGKIMFNAAPTVIKSRDRHLRLTGDVEDVNHIIDTLSKTLEYHMENMLSQAIARIFVM